MAGGKRKVLILGGGFSGLLVARDLASHFHVTVVDAKEFFEYTPGILRAYVKPSHFDALSFTLQPVLEHKMGCKFIWGEVKGLNSEKQTCSVKPMFSTKIDEISYDYCVISTGCNFNFLHKWGESLWFPTIYEDAMPEGSWPHIDERFIEGRRKHIFEEHAKLKRLNDHEATILVCGAGFIGVEWATELRHFFPKLKITICDMLPNCLGPLPKGAQDYCSAYMKRNNIEVYYNVKYDAKNPQFWETVNMVGGADETYICMGVKASSHFMPKETLSDKGPGGGGWIYINKKLQVCDKDQNIWGNGKVFAVGDCNFGCVGGPNDWKEGKGIPPIPKISYPGEEQAAHACQYIEIMENEAHGSSGCRQFCLPKVMKDTWWPWGAGMFATSLGTHDAVFVAGANHNPGSGLACVWGWPAAIQKEIIEASKVDECKNNFVGKAIWHFVHHTPVLLWGRGPWFPNK